MRARGFNVSEGEVDLMLRYGSLPYGAGLPSFS